LKECSSLKEGIFLLRNINLGRLKMRKKIFLFILLLAFFSQPCLHKLNSESLQAKKEPQALQYEVTVTLKLVQVFVTDAKGNPVKDLKKEDFILYDNSKLQEITDFEKHLLARPVARPGKKVEEKIGVTELPSPQVPSKMNRKFILFLDIDRIDFQGLAKSKKAALNFIDNQVQPSDEVAVFSYSRLFGINVYQYFTSDLKIVKKVVESIKEIPGITRTSLVESAELTLAGERARAEAQRGLGAESAINQLFAGQGGDPNDTVARTNDFIENVKALAVSLRYIPGYKNIILFSAGVQESLLFGHDQVLREKYEDMGKELAASNSPVFTVNTMESGRVKSLLMLSELSGGKYFAAVDYVEKIAEQIQNATSNYYVLGYYIDEAWDGKYHQIEVKLKRKDCEVHAQGGYFNRKPFNEFSKFEKKVHLLDLALSKQPYFQEALNLPLVGLPCSQEKESNFVLLSEIRLDELKEVVEATKEKPELVTLILNEKNAVVASTRGEVEPSTLPQKKIFHYAIFSLQPGNYECRMIMRNQDTGRAAVGSCSVEIPGPIKSGLRLFQPLWLIPERESFYLKTAKEKKKGVQEETLSINDVYPFLSNKHSPLIDILDQGISKLLAVVRCSAAGIYEPDIEFSAYITQQPEGQKIPLNFSIIDSKKEKETNILFLEFQLPRLNPGDYSLNLVAEEQKTKQKALAAKNFQVK
jgi:VWFA-related protein